jgi:hypothetical protein
LILRIFDDFLIAKASFKSAPLARTDIYLAEAARKFWREA